MTYELSDLPRFFRDAITIVRALNHRYIWTDYICIENTDSPQRALKIERMGTIYRQAYVTIVNAATGDASKGIAGVNNNPRLTWQRSEQVNGMKLVTSLPSLEMMVKTSAWSRRGWTFQEGLMSTRCIVFGLEQVYYECAEQMCCESMVEPLSGSATPRSSAQYKGVLRDPFLQESSDSTSLYWSLVQDYTSRDLTNASDSLRAFKGFFEYFSALRNMYFLWGLPTNPDLSCNLLWEHGPWIGPSVKRRSDFPSWSWAGWGGAVYMNFPADNDPQITFTLSWAHDGGNVKDTQEKGLVLHCTAQMATVTLAATMLVCVEGDEKSTFMLDCGWDETVEFHGRKYGYMEICRSRESTHGLLLRQRNDGGNVFERFGSGFMQNTTLDEAHTVRKEVELG